MTALINLPGWPAFCELAHQMQQQTLIGFFADNPDRAESMSIKAGPLFLDYSKNHITLDIIAMACDIIKSSGFEEKRAALLSGQPINITEQRAAHHTALRLPFEQLPKTVQTVRQKMRQLVEKLHQRQWLGFSNRPIDTIVNIGIGGSHLGPQLVVDALSTATTPIRCHFLANLDSSDCAKLFANIHPDTTLFIIASKSFSTQETLTNAKTIQQWLLQKGCSKDNLRKHFIAVSSAVEKAAAFGIDKENIFPMWDWVGGRYSLWSAIGLPIALTLGMETFEALLQGAHTIDQHFESAPLTENMPVVMALISFYYQQFWGTQSHALLPYSAKLNYFVDYIQQLDMESNGKQVTKNGAEITSNTGAIIWGNVGTNGQHAFHQLLHQGTHTIPVDFILPINNPDNIGNHQQLMVSHCLAQARALMVGQSLDALKKKYPNTPDELLLHRVIPGNRSSNMLLMSTLNAQSLGALIALYEHRTFVQSCLWDTNAFDQWGVELGKGIAEDIFQALTTQIDTTFDSSTQHLLSKVRSEYN